MKKIIQLLIVAVCGNCLAQDIPLVSQKLTNSFIYNPALAGQTTGSATYTYRTNYSNVEGAPEDHFIGIHTPFSEYRCGLGFNLMHEKVNNIQNVFASAAFAYHIRNRTQGFSAGISAEYGSTVVTGQSNVNPTVNDPVLLSYGNRVSSFDFSAGMNYQSRYFRAGFALNKLASSWITKETSLFANYFSTYIQGMIPVRNQKDLIEPYLSVRRFSPLYMSWDAGLFYSFQDKVMLGLGMRKGNAVVSNLGLYITERLLLAYSYEMNTSAYSKQLGSTSEFSLRLDFSSYAERKRLLKECITHVPLFKTKGVVQRSKIASARNKHKRKTHRRNKR
jgi:type IX secretion system PorP/SprF family membrane protein